MASKSIVTPVGRLCFPSLYQPRSQGEGQEARYSCVLLFDDAAQKSPEYKALKAAVVEVGSEKFGAAKMKEAPFFRSLRLPFRPAGEKSYEGFEEGMTYITLRSKDRPGVVDARLQDITVASDVWAGQLARAFVSPFAYDFQGNRGISFGLNHLQITKRDMARIDGRRAAASVFSAVDEESGDTLTEVKDENDPW